MARYGCSKCKKKKDEEQFYSRPLYHPLGRPVSYDCRACRARSYEKKQDAKWTTICEWCGNSRETFEGMCRKCCLQTGWKVCRTCRQRKLQMDFYSKKADCLTCSSAAKAPPGSEQAG